jgi:hypothetical protein
LFVDEVVRDLKSIRVVGYEDIKNEPKTKFKTELKNAVNAVEKIDDKTIPTLVKGPEEEKQKLKEAPKPKEEKSVSKNAGEIFEKAKEKHRQSLGSVIKETNEAIDKANDTDEENEQETNLF